MRHAFFTMATLLAASVGALQHVNASQSAGTACQLPMASYYATLFASARGDAEGTLRHVIVLQSQWEQVAPEAQSERCAWLKEVVGGRSVLVAVASQIKLARDRLPRDVAGAHAELEPIRLLLRNARASHGLRTFDDALTDYHDAMERLESLLGGRNEVALTKQDFDAIRERARTARTAWADVELHHQELKMSAAWADLSVETDNGLKQVSDRASVQDSAGAHRAAETVRGRYFDLLRMLSRLA